MNDRTSIVYDDLTLTLAQDPDDDVTVTDSGLEVHGRRFAFPDGDQLVVKLAEHRANDLVSRGVATKHSEGDGWVAITDTELWQELASESHTFVGEPAVGGQS
jgi:hypothetical protein